MEKKKLIFPPGILEKLKKKYRESSIKTYNSSFRRMLKLLGMDTDTYDISPFLNVKNVKEALDSIKSTNTRAAHCRCILTILEVEKKIHPRLIKDYKDMVHKYYKAHEALYVHSKDPSNSFVYSLTIDRVYNQLYKIYDKNPNFINFRKYVIISLYKYLPPLRNQDYINTIYIKSENLPKGSLKYIKYNYYDLDEGKMVLYNFKTSKIMEPRHIDFPYELKKIIWIFANKFLLTGYTLIPGIKNKEKPISETTFTFLIRDIFQPLDNVTPNTLRSAYITEMAKIKPVAEMKKIATIMGHKYATQQLIYKQMDQYI